MAKFEYFNSIYKDLITQDTDSSTIKYLAFQPSLIPKLKSLDKIHLLRYSDQLSKFNLNDYVKTQWGRTFKVTDSKVYPSIFDYPRAKSLSQDRIQHFSQRQCPLKQITLQRVIKKQMKRIFYDLQFDQATTSGIIPISIGMVDQKNNQLYLVNKSYDWERSTSWLKQNVQPYVKDVSDYQKCTLEQMRDKVLQFIDPSPHREIKLYGYYSAYDHVALCKLFGTMEDLPEGIPWYTNDLQQSLDYYKDSIQNLGLQQSAQPHCALSDAKFNLQLFKALKEKYSSDSL